MYVNTFAVCTARAEAELKLLLRPADLVVVVVIVVIAPKVRKLALPFILCIVIIVQSGGRMV